MDDEFALCWNNFQDNIASGFQNLYDRGDLVDVTLACDGKLLHAHKIVLAICSPYFQEIFISNPCKHPIIILKDVTVGVMCELLQFMYQGVVNVKHTELQAFMKIAQLLQIKGLASSTAAPQKSPSQQQSSSIANATSNAAAASASGSGTNQSHKHPTGNNNENSNLNDGKTNVPAPSSSSSTSSPSPMPFSHIKSPPENTNPFQTGPGLKRLPEYSTDSLSIYSRKQYRRNTDSSDHEMGPDSMDHVNPEDNFLSTIPHISMVESRFDLNSVKRESNDHTSSPGGLRNSLPPHFGFDYNIYKNNSEYPSDLHIPNDYSKSFGNHMDIPPIAPGERWFNGKLEFMLSQRGKPLLVHDGHTFGIQYVRKDKKYWQCNLSRKFNCKARVTTTETGEIIVTNNEHCHTEIRQHLRKDYQRNKVMMNALINLSTSHLSELRRQQNCNNNSNNFANINNLSTSSSRMEKDYRPFADNPHEATSPTSEEGKTTATPNTDKTASNDTKNTNTSPNDSSWHKSKNDTP